MSPPLKYGTAEIADALAVSPSVVAAARLLGMSCGALRKRVTREVSLKRTYSRCLARGKKQSGRNYRWSKS